MRISYFDLFTELFGNTALIVIIYFKVGDYFLSQRCWADDVS